MSLSSSTSVFRLRYYGLVYVPKDGDYTFHYYADDGATFFIKDVGRYGGMTTEDAVIEDGGITPNTFDGIKQYHSGDWIEGGRDRYATVSLERGLYEMEFHMFEDEGAQALNVWWKNETDGGEEEPIPAFDPEGSDLGYPVFPGVMANIYLYTGTDEGSSGEYVDYANLQIEEVIEK